MADSPENYRAHVGYVLFPRSADDLTDTTRCPACHSPLVAMICGTCGLDVSSPTAIDLADASVEAAAALDRRLDLIGRIRFESSRGAVRPAAAPVRESAPIASPAPQTVPAAASVPVPVPVPVPSAAATAEPLSPAPASPPRRQISVQVVLLLVGVALLSIGAIFFLVYAFINFGLLWRSLIIATVTVAAYVGASLLQKRRLIATAESVAVLAVILTYLDAFAVRANDLLVVGDSQGLMHWGVTLLLSAAGFIAWNRLTGLRVPSIVGFAAIGPGLALLVLGLTESLPQAFPPYLALVALSIGCLAHPLAGRLSRPVGAAKAERLTLMIMATIGLSSATLVAIRLSPETPFAPTVGMLVVALTAAAHADLAIRTRVPIGFSAGFAAIGAVAAGASFAVAGPVTSDDTYSALVPLIAATVIALVIEAVLHHRGSGITRIPLLVATIVAAAMAGIAALPPLGRSLFAIAEVLSRGNGVWSIPGAAALEITTTNVLAVVALAAAVGLVAIAWAIQGVMHQRLHFVLWGAATVLIIAAPLTSVLWGAVAWWMALGIAGAAMLVVFANRATVVRLPVAVGAATALVLGYLTSWTSADTWLMGCLGLLAALAIARFAVTHPLARATLVGITAVAALVTAGAGGWRLQELGADTTSAPVLSTIAITALAVVLVIVSAATTRVLHAAETRALFWIGFVSALFAATSLWITSTTTGRALLEGLIVPGAPSLVAVSVLLTVALLLWMLGSATATFAVERLAASIALAPALAWFAVSLALVLLVTPPTGTLAIFATIAVTLVAACALGIARFSPGLNLRSSVDIGVGLVTLVAVLSVAASLSRLTWLVLVLSAIVALIVSVAPDGLFASASPRRYLGWLSLGLGVTGMVWLLALEQVRDVAAYVLPPAGALLLIAAAAWWSSRRRGLPSGAAPWIALAGLLVALVPLGIAHGETLTLWLIVVASVSAALLVGGTLLRPAAATQPYLDAAAIAGAVGLLASAYGRSYVLALDPAGPNELVIWIASAFAIFTIAAFGVAVQARSYPGRLVPSQALLGVPMLATFLLGVLAIGNGPSGILGPVTLVLLFSAIHVLSGILDRAPFTRIMGWVSIGLAVATWLTTSALGQLHPLEWATVPIGIALLITGGVHLGKTPAARSWQWLAPGVLVTIAPSLLASFVDEPIWRLVGVGLACVVAIVAGALLRLQAPLVLGSALVLVHALRTFAPQLIAVYQLTEWWVWAVVGGAIIFFIGFTFEKRKRDFQTTATKIASLR